MRIEHVALWTKEIESLRAFYERYFDASCSERYVNEEKKFQSYFLSFASGARLELMQNPDLQNLGGSSDRNNYTGYAHLAISLGSEEAVDQMTEHLINDGHQIISGPRRTGDSYYESVVLDPDGNRIEITV